MAELRFPYGYAKDSNGVMGMGTMLTRKELEVNKQSTNSILSSGVVQLLCMNLLLKKEFP